jgi:hypothetical protein
VRLTSIIRQAHHGAPLSHRWLSGVEVIPLGTLIYYFLVPLSFARRGASGEVFKLFRQDEMRPYIAIYAAHVAHVDVGIAQTFALGLAVTCERVSIGIIDNKSKFIEADNTDNVTAAGEVATDDNGAIFDDFLFDL